MSAWLFFLFFKGNKLLFVQQNGKIKCFVCCAHFLNDDIYHGRLKTTMTLYLLNMQLLFVSSGLCNDRSSRKPPAWQLRCVHPGSLPHPPEHCGPHPHHPDDPWGRWVADSQHTQCRETGLRAIADDWFPSFIRAWWQVPRCSVPVFNRNSLPELDRWYY